MEKQDQLADPAASQNWPSELYVLMLCKFHFRNKKLNSVFARKGTYCHRELLLSRKFFPESVSTA